MATVNQNMFAANVASDRPGGVSLLLLPLNLIAQIVSNVADTADLARLCRTCRVFNYMALPQLYRSLTLTSYDKIRYRGELPEGSGSASPFTMGLNAVITRPYATLVQSICLRGEWKESDIEEYAQVGRVPDSSMLLNVAVRAAVDRMQSLESFSWELNTKMLETVYAGLTGLPHLTSLTIRFPSTRHPQPAFALPGMPNLRRLKITDIDPLCYPDDISTILLKSRQLRDLRLHWSPRMRRAQEPSVSLHDYFRKCIAAKQPLAVTKLSFQNLYAFHSEEFNLSFNPTTMEDVTFLSGSDTVGLMNTFMDNSWPNVIPHRELKIKSMRLDTIAKRNADFLGSFKGLEKLYMVNTYDNSCDSLNSPRPGGSADFTPTIPQSPVGNGTTASSPVAAVSPAHPSGIALSVRDTYLANITLNHGATLRHLLLCAKWPLSTSIIARLVHSCPNLEQLALATDVSSLDSLSMLVPFLRKLVALRLLIPPGSPHPSSSTALAVNPATVAAGLPGGGDGWSPKSPSHITASPQFLENLRLYQLPKAVENVIATARSLADIVNLDDEYLMNIMSRDMADQQNFGNLRIVGMGWKAFELRGHYKVYVPTPEPSGDNTPAAPADTAAPEVGVQKRPVSSQPITGVNGQNDTASTPLHRSASMPSSRANGAPPRPSTTVPPSLLGKRSREDSQPSQHSQHLPPPAATLSHEPRTNPDSPDPPGYGHFPPSSSLTDLCTVGTSNEWVGMFCRSGRFGSSMLKRFEF
ncbi:hypothetical protein N7539_003986 [Penicillium diatomitis]|uniref:F-box domain-containing protein n=1 Tax=Penicillium diatomitis TaxID=2819901 RepID=A0A9W9XD33_9EURO|nr:uncharacterized protein N7539_003986 [Penicillium diatomitis]KAJ5489096.1 hypothetical protein N7539_003986 [Penicillium diatomitis]